MTQAVAYGEAENGQQSTSSGLILHRGPLNAALVRAVGSQQTGQVVWPRDGQGSGSSLELAHYPKQSSNIQSYDRDTSQWLNLDIYGKNISLNPQGGKLTMPAGSAQALLGYYWNPISYTVPSINTWTETPVTANITSTNINFPWRIEFGVCIGNPTKGAVVYVGLGLDGNVSWPSLALFHVPEANFLETVSGVMYAQNAANPGPHRVSVFIYTGTANTSINSGAYATLWVTEQRA